MYIYIPCTCTLLFIYWVIFSVYSCTVIFCRDLVYRSYRGAGEILEKEKIGFQVDEMKKEAMLVAQIMNTPPCFLFFKWNPSALFCWRSFCLCPKFTSLTNISVHRGFFKAYVHAWKSYKRCKKLPVRLLFCVTAEFSQEDVGTLLVLIPEGKLWHLTFRLNLACS